MPRPPVTGARLEEFLRRLGRDFRGTGRLYLVGGAQMVQAGLRRQTQDVDYTVRLDAVYQEPFSLALRALIRELEISVEPAGPGDFIPLPSGWEERSPFLGRYGGLDVFAFDPVSTALAKIERGTSQDIDDVIALLSVGRLDLAELARAFDEILPRLERESLRIDEDDFRRKFAAFLNLPAAHGPDDTPAHP
jgi:hypothetical protein